MEEKIYSTQEINQIINFNDPSGRGSGQKRLIPRCERAGLIIKSVPIKGNRKGYKILENNIDKENEIWIDCYLNNKWEVSNFGRIRKKNGKQPMGHKNPQGYITVCTNLEGQKATQYAVHRLIYFSFYPSKDTKNMVIDHIDGKRDNNNLTNLRCLTNVQNLQERDYNQSKIKTLTTDLVVKYGYQKVEKFLRKGLTNLENMI